MPNAIIVEGMATIVGSAYLHHKQDNEGEDEAGIDGITEDDVEDEEEDMVGTTRSPRSASACCSNCIGIRWAWT